MEEGMKAVFEGATLKVWFLNAGISRNFTNVAEIVQEGNALLIKTENGDQHLLNFENVNMIEEIETDDMDKQMRELKAKFKKV